MGPEKGGVVIILLVVVGSVLCTERPCRRPRKGAAVIPLVVIILLIIAPMLISQIANTEVTVAAVASLAVVTAGEALAAVFATVTVLCLTQGLFGLRLSCSAFSLQPRFPHITRPCQVIHWTQLSPLVGRQGVRCCDQHVVSLVDFDFRLVVSKGCEPWYHPRFK